MTVHTLRPRRVSAALVARRRPAMGPLAALTHPSLWDTRVTEETAAARYSVAQVAAYLVDAMGWLEEEGTEAATAFHGTLTDRHRMTLRACRGVLVGTNGLDTITLPRARRALVETRLALRVARMVAGADAEPAPVRLVRVERTR